MPTTLQEIEAASRKARDPLLVAAAEVDMGGVDPLGLRQINFDLMDRIFPGLNNVARHIRPFTIVTWAWRRTIALAAERQLDLPLSMHEDFVARIEVAFVWSMLQHYDAGDIDLPGKQLIAGRWGDASRIRFGDEDWRTFVTSRRNSTALTAAINYGPGLRSLRLLDDDAVQRGVRVQWEGTDPMLDAFEARISPMLSHKLFRGWDECSLTSAMAEKWASLWDFRKPLRHERDAMQARLAGNVAPASRRGGFDLLARAVEGMKGFDDDDARPLMCEVEDADSGPALLWRQLQTRQAFRFALESLFEWIIMALGGESLTTDALAQLLLHEVGGDVGGDTDAWLRSILPDGDSPVDAMDRLETSFRDDGDLAPSIFSALALVLLSDPSLHDGSDTSDRLPIALAAQQTADLADRSPLTFLAHVIERWVISQHTYWSVGRGLADARAGARPILRLRIVLEQSGWRVTRGRGHRSMPVPTPDRLRTAISLARECRLLRG